MRRRLPWLVVLPLLVAGSLAAHALSYALPIARAEAGGQELGEPTSTSAGSYSVLAIGMVAALLAAAGLSWLLARARARPRRGAPPWLFFLLPPLAFSLQELGERGLRVEAAPFQAVFEPRFLVGLALQIPFGLVALLLARVLLRVVVRIACGLARPRLLVVARCRVLLVGLLFGCELPRIAVLALGYPQRGPPPG